MLRTFGSQGVQAISSLAVARILEPRDYGLFALALTLVAAARAFGDLGITYSLVVKRQITDTELRAGVGVAAVVGVAAGLAISLVWSRLGLVRSAGGSAVWLGPALATTILIGLPALPSTTIMERDLKFSRLGVIGVGQAIATFGTQVLLLLLGVGVWSMVIAQIVGTTVGTGLTVRASGRLFTPSLRGPVMRLVSEGVPFGVSIWAYMLSGAATNMLVAVQLGARGVGFFGWCTILATPINGGLAAVHSVSVPTFARMRRDDGTRYEESVVVVIRTVGTIAAISAGCLIGLASPTIRYVFGPRWLPATSAVQFCLAGTMVGAFLSVLVSDANARLMRRETLVASITGAAATLAFLWPLSALDGVGGASLAATCVGPAAAVAVLAWSIPFAITRPLLRTLRLFAPLVAISFVLNRLVHTPVEFAAACFAMGAIGVAAVFVAEGQLMRRVLGMLRAGGGQRAAVEAVSGTPA